MSNKKSFLLGVLTGVLALALLIGFVIGGMKIYETVVENREIAYDEGKDDEEIVESTGVFADTGNAIITDIDEIYNIEIIPPSGFTVGEDYESAYEMEYYNEDQTQRLDYSIENYTLDEMQSYYEFDKEQYENSNDGFYSNVATTELQTLEANGYTVNYVSLSYTYNETENYTQYCAFVMLTDSTEFMCNISGEAGDVNEAVVQECFESQLPVTK
ncbi:MAG: hypothetical protein ACERKZ_04255 [Lachnotalea sp.]